MENLQWKREVEADDDVKLLCQRVIQDFDRYVDGRSDIDLVAMAQAKQVMLARRALGVDKPGKALLQKLVKLEFKPVRYIDSLRREAKVNETYQVKNEGKPGSKYCVTCIYRCVKTSGAWKVESIDEGPVNWLKYD